MRGLFQELSGGRDLCEGRRGLRRGDHRRRDQGDGTDVRVQSDPGVSWILESIQPDFREAG